MTLTYNPNTQNDSDLLEVFLAVSPDFRFSRRASYYQFQQTQNMNQSNSSTQNLGFNLRHNLFRVTNFAMKHAVLSLILLTTLAISVGASAAEFVLPVDSQLKPSNVVKSLFGANKQADRDPYTRLIPDADNYVSDLSRCDLALKFPKLVESEAVSIGSTENTTSSRYDIYIENTYKSQTLSIECVSSKAEPIVQQYFQQQLRIDREVGMIQNLTSSELRKDTGWFITEGELSDIQKISIQGNSTQKIVYLFTSRNTQHRVTLNRSGLIQVNNLQLQFNSLVKNQFSNDISIKDTSNIIGNVCQETLTSVVKPGIDIESSKTLQYSAISWLKYDVADSETSPERGLIQSLVTLECYPQKGEEGWKTAVVGDRQIPIAAADVPFLSTTFKQRLNPARITKITMVGDPNEVVAYYFMTQEGHVFGLNAGDIKLTQAYGLNIDLKQPVVPPSNSSPSQSSSSKSSSVVNTDIIKLKNCSVELQTTNPKCFIQDIQTGKNLLMFRDCTDGGVEGRCVYKEVVLGKIDNGKQYLIEDGGEGPVNFMTVYQFDSKTNQVSKIGHFEISISFEENCDPLLYPKWPALCFEGDNNTKENIEQQIKEYKEYLEAQKKYMK